MPAMTGGGPDAAQTGITVVGLGPGDLELLTVSARRAIDEATALYVRTERHPTVVALQAEGKTFASFDHLYERGSDFDTLYQSIVAELLRAGATQPVVYAVPGHPLVAERTVLALLAQKEIPVRVIAGLSGLEATYTALGINPAEGLQILDALGIEGLQPNPEMACLVLQVYNRRVAGQVKLHLMRFYPDEHPVRLVTAASVSGEEVVRTLPLFELDRVADVNHLSSLYVPSAPAIGVERLRQIVDRLRGPGGCPWDQEQTHQSLTRYMLEEAYEAIDAIESGDTAALIEELGDVLLQVVLHARIAEESDEGFDLREVADAISDKLIFRHPHVFGDAQVANTDEVLANWEVLKQVEKHQKGVESASLLGQLPAMAALGFAEKTVKRAMKVGFAWPDVAAAQAKLQEEWQEFELAIATADKTAMAAELGDFLFAIVGVAAMLKLDPEVSLRAAVRRFVSRFEQMESVCQAEGDRWEQLSLDDRLALWMRVKRIASTR